MRGAWCGALAAFLLPGCALLEMPKEGGADVEQARLWQAHQEQVEDLDVWSLQGRFGLQWHDGQVQGGLQWRQVGRDFELRLSGPFGLNPVRLVGNLRTGQATLYDGETEIQGEVEAVMREHLGFALPLAELVNLVRGIPVSVADEVMLDDQARAVRIFQGGWEIEYRDYSCCEAPVLPGRVRFVQDKLRGVLVVREWSRE